MTYGRRHYITQQILVRLAYAGPTSAETREFLKATMRFLVALTLGFLTLAAVASGAELQEEAGTGEFRYRRGPAEAFEVAPMIETRVRFDVTGVIARATVVQRFKNPLDVWIEGVYVFPLPEDAAVDHLSMRVGERVIEGQIREKQQAREEFRQAAAEGKRASLIEQERANLFTAAVANLGPNEELEVEIEYQETLDLDEGRVGLTFPLAITPRYTPGICNLSGTGGPSSGTGGVVATNPVSIELRLNAGFEVASLTSSTHPIDVESSSGQTFKARLRGGQVPADRDFEISWTPSPGVMPRSSVTTQRGPDGTYALVSLFPPTGQAALSARLPREVTFVIDTSGSMAGASMEQAKKALVMAIKRLEETDTFNVIEFNSETSVLFSGPAPASPANEDRAITWVESLDAGGGTEMLPALIAALVEPSQGVSEPRAGVRQVIFLTDGAVGNEDELFSIIKDRLGRARLFTVGIGSAPNRHFMTKAAQFGRGTFTFIADVLTVEKSMAELYAKIETPVLSDIRLSFDGAAPELAEVWPDRIPDLYLGEPLVVGVRFERPPTAIRVSGERDGQPFSTVVPLDEARSGVGINVLWARRKIQSLLDGIHEGDDPEAVRAQVVSLGLAHHLVTDHTSLVAVDVTPSRPLDEGLERVDIPLTPPHGAPGSLPQTATPAALFLLQGLSAILATFIVLAATRR